MAATPKLTLKYFDLPSGGKGEPIRLALTFCGIPFEDYLFASRDEFKELKESGKLLFGQVPALFVGEGVAAQVLNETPAILRYVAKLGGGKLYPSDPLLSGRVDAIMDFEADALQGARVNRYKARFGFAPETGFSDEVAAQVANKLNAVVLPNHLRSLARVLESSGTGWLAGTEGPSIADFLWVPTLQGLLAGWSGDESLLKPHPSLLELVKRFMALPEVEAYYEAKHKSS